MTALAILGPTASGKSAVAVAIARATGAAIVSVDSMQVYRGMDIGTAKPSKGLRSEIPHRMVDVVEPETAYSVAEFQRDGRRAIEQLDAAGVPVVIAGGTGLHFRALVDPLDFPPTDPGLRATLEARDPEGLVLELLNADPGAAALVDVQNPRRVLRAVEIMRLTGETPSQRAAARDARRVREYVPRMPVRAIGLDPGPALRGRIEARFDAMLATGLIDEVQSLVGRLGPTASQAVGYKELIPFVAGEATLDSARTAALNATAALGKRQRTFFRRDPRIVWLPWQDDSAARIEAALAAAQETSWIS